MRVASVTRTFILLLSVIIDGTPAAALEVAHFSTIGGDHDIFNNVLSKPERNLENTTDAILFEECRSSDEAYPTSGSSDSRITVKRIEGSATPIMIVDNFLGVESLQTLYEDVVTRNNWNPYITNHVREYRKKGLGDDGLFRPRTPPAKVVSKSGLVSFPGLRLNLPMPYNELVRSRLQQLNLNETFSTDNLRFNWNRESFLGNTCYHPSVLSADQSMPQLARGRIALTRNQQKPIKLVVHHYISHWNGNGGTAFYLDRATNRSHFSDPECRQLIKQVKRKKKPPTPGQKRNPCAEAGCHCKVEGITPKYCKKQCEIRGQQTGYLGNQSEFYTTAHHVPYQFDRAVIFSPLLLHSAFLEEEDVVRLSCDPAKGRLVATFYVV